MADAGMAKPSVNGQVDKRRPQLRKITAEPLGVRLLVDGSRISAGADHFLAKVDILRAGFRCRSIKVRQVGHDVELRLRFEEPFTRIIRFNELPAPTRPGHVVSGRDEDGDPVEKDLRLPQLFVGAQGAGKSSETQTILRGIVAAGIPFRLRIFDPKGGQEYTELEDAAWEYERDPTKWPAFLEHACRAMAAKQAAMRVRGMRKLSAYTEEFPLDVMVIDELITALAFGGQRKLKMNGREVSAEDAFMMYLSTARSAGCTVLASTQLAQKEVIGKIRGLFGYITVLRLAPTERDMLDVLLGSGASKAYPAHHLSADEREAGIGYTSTRRGVVKYRAAYLTDHEHRIVHRGVAGWTKLLRPELVEAS